MKIWLKAFRLRTLPLSLSSIFMGAFLAGRANAFRWDIFLMAVLTTIFLQILSNLANDYGDSIHGADNADRKGPQRAVQSGAISKEAMKRAVILFVILCLGSGISLLFLAFGTNWQSIGVFLLLGLLSIAAAIAYTVGKKPYGYAGLGDISVFIFFGCVGVLGSYYLFTKQLNWEVLMPAISCGVFAVAVLNINNIRDIESDLKAGKYSVPVRIGKANATLYHGVLIICGIVAAVLYNFFTFQTSLQWLFLLATPLLFLNLKAVTQKPSEQLDPYLRQMALATLLFVILFGLGIVLR
jgi:1,4-dihydroxy-2-naphthoate octaprenyltransferase